MILQQSKGSEQKMSLSLEDALCRRDYRTSTALGKEWPLIYYGIELVWYCMQDRYPCNCMPFYDAGVGRGGVYTDRGFN